MPIRALLGSPCHGCREQEPGHSVFDVGQRRGSRRLTSAISSLIQINGRSATQALMTASSSALAASANMAATCNQTAHPLAGLQTGHAAVTFMKNGELHSWRGFAYLVGGVVVFGALALLGSARGVAVLVDGDRV